MIFLIPPRADGVTTRHAFISPKFLQYFFPFYLLSFNLVFPSLTPQVLYAQEIAPGKKLVDATLSNHDFPLLTSLPVSPTVDQGEATSMEWASLPLQSLEQKLGDKAKNDVAAVTTPVFIAQVPPQVKPPSLEPSLEQQPLPQLPAPDQLLPQPTPQPTQPESPSEGNSATFIVKRFKFIGNTAFSSEELAKAIANYTNRPISFAELLQARSEITKYYADRGYVTSGAIIPPQTSKTESGVVTLQVVEGSLESINVTGTRKLKPSYISSRIGVAATKPLNINRLLEGLQLLQLNPLIQNLSADLQAGTRPGSNILQVKVTEADTFSTNFVIDNTRSPSVGSMRRRVVLNQANLLGFGDSLSLGYTNTDGSNGGDIKYTLPVNPRNGQLSLAFGLTNSHVLESPFDRLDISSKSRYYELSFRQPVIETPTEQLDLGITFSHQQSQTFLGVDNIGPYPLSPGADEQGRTSTSTLRFFQQWTKRSNQQVLAFRSQFNLGLGILGATINNNGEPDSRFLSWQGQAQWVRQLAPDTLLLLNGNAQLSNTRLLGLEQFALGGQESVRGYRQDFLLKDNGLLGSAEVRLPILRASKIGGLLQIAPFIDVGTGWNSSGAPASNSPNTLIGTGVGLLWRQGNNLTVRLDFGVPLISIKSKGDTLQEKGIYFSINYTPF